MKERKEQKAVPMYVCGYKHCSNTQLSVAFEDEKEIKIYCQEHDAYTWWSKKEKPQSQVMKPEFKDIYKAVK